MNPPASYHRDPRFWRHLRRVLLLGAGLTAALAVLLAALPLGLPWEVALLPAVAAGVYWVCRLAYRDAGIRRREGAGQCPRCGYDLRAQLRQGCAQCPECGLPLAASRRPDGTDGGGG